MVASAPTIGTSYRHGCANLSVSSHFFSFSRKVSLDRLWTAYNPPYLGLGYTAKRPNHSTAQPKKGLFSKCSENPKYFNND